MFPYNKDASLKSIVRAHQGGHSGCSGHYLLIYSIVLGLETKKAFEFGSGGSTFCILEALKQTRGKLLSCDPLTDYTGNTRASVDVAELDRHTKEGRWHRLQMYSDKALQSLTNETFEFVLHDGSHTKEQVVEDLKGIVLRIKQYGILLTHDTQHDTLGKGMREAVQGGLKGIDHTITTLPYSYGLSIIRIEQDLGNGRVNPTWHKEGSAPTTPA